MQKQAAVTLRATLYDASGTDRVVELTEGVASKLDKRQLLWVDVDERDDNAIDRLIRALDLPEDVGHHLKEPAPDASLLRYPNVVQLRIVALQPDESAGHRLGISPPRRRR